MQQQQPTPEEISPEGQPLTSEQFNQILKAGEEAARLLQSQVFNIAYQSVLRDSHIQWLNTQPKESAKREGLYLECLAMEKMVEKLKNAVGDAERLLEEQQQASQPNGLDMQGFGLNQ